MTVKAQILVVDDDRAIRDALDRALRFEGYGVALAEDGEEALETVAVYAPDMIVLDVLMPGVDGLEVCRRLRATGDSTPVLMLTARHMTQDRVAGLDVGADDYLVKPFALEELLARVRALLRRAVVNGDGGIYEVADLTLDPATRRVFRGDRELELTKTEFALLELLIANAEIVMPRERIFDRVWGFDGTATSNTLDVYVGYVRRKLEAGGEPRLLHTVRGVGYVLRAPR
jgi:two-component system response regulator MprA